MDSYNNSSHTESSRLHETLEELNLRYTNTLIPNYVLLGLFVIVGVLGNSLVLIVFARSKHYNNSNFRTFVIFLAMIDIFTCVVIIPTEMFKIRSHFSFNSSVLCKSRCFLNTFETSTAAFTLLIISVDRYRKVCKPLKRQILPGQAIQILLFMLSVSLLISLPAPVLCGISKATKINKYNTTTNVSLCYSEKKFENSIWRFIYKSSMTFCMVVVSVSLIIMYSAIGRKVIRHIRSKENRNNGLLEISKIQKQSEKGTEVTEICSNLVSFQDLNVRTFHFDKAAKDTSETTEEQTNIRPNNSFPPRATLLPVMSISEKIRTKTICDSPTAKSRILKTGSRKIPYKTTIWFILTLLFIVTYLLYAVLTFMVPSMYKMSPESFMVYYIFYRFYFINNIINPFIYALLDKKFQNSCKGLFSAAKKNILRL